MCDKILPKGVFPARKKNGELYYRVSITYKSKHISLGSFNDIEDAGCAYTDARNVLNNSSVSLHNYSDAYTLSFEKFVCLINFRDNGMYIKNPIYILPKYFEYYYSRDDIYKFDVDDLFFYSKHKIMKRNGHLFVADYGMQTNIMSRYGIHSHSVAGRDYIFVNGDYNDFRYGNIKIINKYKGVFKDNDNGRDIFTAKIHINGDFIIGRYHSEAEAATAYNKAANILKENGVDISYGQNYIEELSPIQYASTYNAVKISPKILNYNLWFFLSTI